MEQEADQSRAGATSWRCVMCVNGFVKGGWCHSGKQMVDVVVVALDFRAQLRQDAGGGVWET